MWCVQSCHNKARYDNMCDTWYVASPVCVCVCSRMDKFKAQRSTGENEHALRLRSYENLLVEPLSLLVPFYTTHLRISNIHHPFMTE